LANGIPLKLYSLSLHAGIETFLEATGPACAAKVLIDYTLLVEAAGEALIAQYCPSEESL